MTFQERLRRVATIDGDHHHVFATVADATEIGSGAHTVGFTHGYNQASLRDEDSAGKAVVGF